MLPELAIKITADPKQATAGLGQVDKAITQTGSKASTATNKTAGLSSGLKGLGNASNATRAKIQNASFQLSDFIVQVQGGTAASRAAAQQMPQLLGAFGALGAVLGVVAGIGIPAVATAMTALGGSSKSLEDALGDLAETMTDVEDITKLMNSSTADLSREFAGSAREIRAFISAMSEVSLREMRADVDDLSHALAFFYDGGFMWDSWGAEAAAALDLTSGELDVLADAVQSLKLADGLNAQAEAARNMRIALVSAVGPAEDMTSAQFEYFSAIVETEAEIRKAIALVSNMEAENELAAQAAGTISDAMDVVSSRIDTAIGKAEGLSGAFSDAAQAAETVLNRMAAAASINSGAFQSELDQGKIAEAYAQYGASRGAAPDTPVIHADDTETTERTGGGGRSDPLSGLQDDLAAMQERFMSEQELIDLAHDTELESLAEFRDAKLISMAEYNTLEEQLAAEHEDKLTEIQRAAQMARLSGWAGAFGDLSTLMSSENKKMQKIGEFAAKAQIGLEGIQSASSAWQKGMAIGGPPTAAAFAAMSVAKTAALMSQVGSSSGGPSSGGTSSGTATSAAESGASNITNINANIAPNANYQGSVVTELFDMINQASADGNQIILRSV